MILLLGSGVEQFIRPQFRNQFPMCSIPIVHSHGKLVLSYDLFPMGKFVLA